MRVYFLAVELLKIQTFSYRIVGISDILNVDLSGSYEISETIARNPVFVQNKSKLKTNLLGKPLYFTLILLICQNKWLPITLIITIIRREVNCITFKEVFI